MLPNDSDIKSTVSAIFTESGRDSFNLTAAALQVCKRVGDGPTDFDCIDHVEGRFDELYTATTNPKINGSRLEKNG